MKELIENLFWIGVIILGSSYLLFIEVKNYKNKRKVKVKYIFLPLLSFSK